MAFGAQGPIDYSSLLQQAQPAQQFNAGLQAGNNVVQMGIQQQQQQLQLNMQKQMALDFHNLAANPTTQNIAAMAAKYPQMAGNFKSAYDMLTTQQQKAQQDQLYPVYAALNSGNPQLAAQNLRLAATAAQNSGDTAGAARYNQWATLATTAPSYVKSMVGFGLASTGGPQQFTQNMSTMGANERAQELQPSAVKNSHGECYGCRRYGGERSAGSAA